jgi:hypothetical protein
MNTISYI